MSQLQLKAISKEIIAQAEDTLVPAKGLSRAVDEYFIQRLKEDELRHAEVDASLYEGLRKMVKVEVLPLYEQFRLNTAHLRDRRHKRKVWTFVLGTVGVCVFLEAILTRGRSIVPQVLIPTAILYSLIGFIVYAATQYVDDLRLARARKHLERSIEGLEAKVQTDAAYDNRRQLLDADVLRAEAVEILARYDRPEEFWRDYLKVRQADPTVPSELKPLNTPAFERFLKFHVGGLHSEVARQHRFNRLFIEAQEIFMGRDRQHYVIAHLNGPSPKQL